MSIEVLEDVTVNLIQHAGGDASIVHAARVSADVATLDWSGEAGKRDRGLINALMREKHGTPFEHNSITLMVEAPIFVFREWHRHRIQSFNEMSGRYTQLPPRFYSPAADRPLVNAGTSMKPKMVPADPQIVDLVQMDIEDAYQYAWATYQTLLGYGIANEVARIVLPVGIMSQMYATANLRAWLHFISLRTTDGRAAFPGHPQREIEMAAEKIEAVLTDLFPIALEAFNKNGRVAP